MNRSRRALSAAALLGAELAAVAALHRLGRIEGFALPRRDVGHWLTHATTEDLVAATARVAGLALVAWLLIATVLSIARRAVPGWRRLRALDSLTPAALRRVVDRTVAVGLGASLVMSATHGAGGAAQPTRARVDIPVVRSPDAPASSAASAAPSAPRPAPPTAPSPGAIVVRAGDNLWLIAQRALESERRGVRSAEIAPYWRRVIAANAATLRSHDPNLIFPGERIVLPPLTIGDEPAG